MKNTKARILQTALHLFNDLGLPKVTLRTIAKEMGISQGNLNYHFKKREDILEALYHDLVAKIDQLMESMQGSVFSLQHLYDQQAVMMEHFFEYRFFMLDFVQIMREHANIKNHYTQLTELRILQFQGLIQALVELELMRPGEIEDEYKHFHIRLQILNDFWLSSAITTKTLSKALIPTYSMALFRELYPYLTPKGKTAFQAIKY